jgi:hypothetical protein
MFFINIYNKYKKIIFISIAVCIVLYTIIWYIIANLVTNGLNNEIAALPSKNIRFTVADIDTTGFPFGINAFIEKPRFINKTATFGWRTDSFYIQSQNLSGSELTLSFPDQHHIAYRYKNDKKPFNIYITDKKLEALIKLNNYRFDEVNLRADNLNIAINTPNEERFDIHAIYASIKANQFVINRNIIKSIALNLQLEKLTLPTNLYRLFDQDIHHFKIESVLYNVGEIEDLAKGIPQSYKNSQPTLQIDSFEFEWKPLSLRGKGELSINQNGLIEGRMIIDALGYMEALNILEQKEVFNAEEATQIRSTLTFYNLKRSMLQNTNYARLDITVKNGVAYWNNVAIFKIPPIQL